MLFQQRRRRSAGCASTRSCSSSAWPTWPSRSPTSSFGHCDDLPDLPAGRHPGRLLPAPAAAAAAADHQRHLRCAGWPAPAVGRGRARRRAGRQRRAVGPAHRRAAGARAGQRRTRRSPALFVLGRRAAVLPARRRGDDQRLRLRRPLRRDPAGRGLVAAAQGSLFGFFFPMAFTAYLPAVTLLGLPGPAWLPAWLGWCAPARRGRGRGRWRCCAGAGECGTTREAADDAWQPERGSSRPTGLTREFRVRDGRRRRTVTAVDGLTVRIEPGEAVGYIGANGAGKSTTIKMLVGILVPTAGTRAHLRAAPGRRTGGGWPARSAWCSASARSCGGTCRCGSRSASWPPSTRSTRPRKRSRTAELVEQLELGGFLVRPVRQLSLGQRMRAEVAAALLHSPAAGDPRRADHRPRRAVQAAAAGVPRSPSAASTAPRCCSPPTTWATSSGCATGCWSSTTAGSPTTGTLAGLSAHRRRRAGARRRPGRARADLTGLDGDPAPVGARAGGLRQRLAFDAERDHGGAGCWPRWPSRPRSSTSPSRSPTSRTSCAGSTPRAADPAAGARWQRGGQRLARACSGGAAGEPGVKGPVRGAAGQRVKVPGRPHRGDRGADVASAEREVLAGPRQPFK